jgi:predicted nucleic acid-binding protein
MKQKFLLLSLVVFFFSKAIAQPATGASTPPTRNSSDVISIFSSAYNNVDSTDWFPNWGQGTVVTDYIVGVDTTKKYDMLDYQGVQFKHPINASPMTNLHVDIWSANCNAFQFFLINQATTAEQYVTLRPNHTGWNSYDIDLTQYAAGIVANVGQLKFVDSGFVYHASTTVVYLDNIYFWKSASVPTITGFSVPAKMVGDAAFNLTAPTSNSMGAFTYTSSNTSVATIIGNTVTIVGGGTSLITANQAPDAGYTAGSTSANLVVSFAVPMVAAPVPTTSSIDVISLFSDTYTNVAGIDWFPGWGQSTIASDIMIAGNTTRKYDNMNYQGVQFADSVNASTATHLHIDIWTPNCTDFKVSLINLSPTVEQVVTLKPTLNGWNSFEIDLSQYTTINKTKIRQLKFESVPFGGGVVYADNIYFYRNASAPTITGFSVPAKMFGDAAFNLTAPTSNSMGAFTYTSSNTSVATIVGNTVTIVGAGTSVITANQAANGAYSAGSVTANLVVSFAVPMMAAPVPTTPSIDVISLFSDTYTNVAGINWFPGWGQSTIASDIMIAGNTTRKYDNMNYQGVQFADSVNASTATHLHIDIWTPNCTDFKVSLINLSPTVEQAVTLTPTLNGWNSFNIDLSQYTTINKTKIGQLKFESVPFGGGVVYADNIYFYRNASAPTITGFSVPAKMFGDAAFNLTAPTSNSMGAFTYTSSNTSVATIVGNTVTIVGAGTSVITANQAANGAYSAGSVIANLVVSFAVPMVAAPVPTVSSTYVISLFSDTYTNVAGIDWFPGWGQSTVATDIMIAGNTTRKYDNMNYQGVQLAGALDVSTATHLHIDIWTPNCTAFKLFLINLSPTVEQAVTLTPTLNGWNSFNIDLSQYTTINKSSIGQLKFESVPFGGGIVYVDNIYFYNQILPVSLINFTATKKENTAILNWATATETNNYGFAVERSNDAKNFEQIKFVKGNGTTAIAKEYSAIDNNPTHGTNYYRLKQIDNNGKFVYSNTQIVTFNSKSDVGFTFYPNPAKNKLVVTLENIASKTASLQLVNILGKTVATKAIGNQQANSNVSFDVSTIAKGIYFLTFKDGTTIKTSKVIIE